MVLTAYSCCRLISTVRVIILIWIILTLFIVIVFSGIIRSNFKYALGFIATALTLYFLVYMIKNKHGVSQHEYRVRQAQVILGYAKAFLSDTKMLAALVSGETQEGIELRTGVTIEITTADYRKVRGRTLVAALLDEAAFWRDSETSADAP